MAPPEAPTRVSGHVESEDRAVDFEAELQEDSGHQDGSDGGPGEAHH